MELIVAILFFSLAGTVCIQLFVHSHTLSTETVNMNNAIIETQNMAELYYSSEGNIANICEYYAYPELNNESGHTTLTVFFDNDWNNIDSSLTTPSYLVILDGVEAPDEGNNVKATISALTADSSGSEAASLYELELKHHIQYKKGDVIDE
jgi:hypothetical protein